MSFIGTKEAWVADLQKIRSSALVLFFVGAAIIVWHTGWGGSGLPLMAAIASLAGGSSIGFLFGIPKTLQGNSSKEPLDKSSPQARNDEKDRAHLETNTNLEQISDWLTKILVGAGLVQFRQLIAFFHNIARQLSLDMSQPTRSETFAAFLMIYFLVGGFLMSYLLTRLYLPGALSRAEVQKLREVETRVQEMSSKLENVLESDPNKGKFGGKAEANSRKVSANVLSDKISDENFIIRTEVCSTDPTKPLSGLVTFHLHPTLSPTTRSARPENNVARLDCKAWGAFTVGIEIEGEDTRLELDLSELPDAPLKFKSR